VQPPKASVGTAGRSPVRFSNDRCGHRRTGEVKPDAVDRIVAQWATELPELDVSTMGIVGRLARLDQILRASQDEVFRSHGLEAWEFDVLATLRRSGKPYVLTPTELIESMMVASGTMTNRIDRLAGRGLVERRKDAADGRVVRVALSRTGKALVERALPDHVNNQSRMLRSLNRTQRSALEAALRSMLGDLTA
jgi:DNA-binding MarR family transcriptional regulator